MTITSPERAAGGTRFLAYAAHELRGHIALQLVLAEATLTNPDADVSALREMGEGVVASCQRQERLLEALLALCRSEHGLLQRQPVDLATTAAAVLRTHDDRRFSTLAALEPARTTGEPQLIERLVANLVSNAIRHNIPGGRLAVRTHTTAGRAIFTIENTGAVIPPGEVSRLFEPFERLGSQCGASATGTGLGLAIVQAIADAHHAALTAYAPSGGGLRINVAMPALA